MIKSCRLVRGKINNEYLPTTKKTRPLERWGYWIHQLSCIPFSQFSNGWTFLLISMKHKNSKLFVNIYYFNLTTSTFGQFHFIYEMIHITELWQNKNVSLDAKLALSLSMFSGSWNLGKHSNLALKLGRSYQ